MWEARRCPDCLNFDSYVPLPRDRRLVTWEEHGNRVINVEQYRCLACAAADIIRRDWMKRHEKDEPQPGQAAPIDGRMFVASELTEEA